METAMHPSMAYDSRYGSSGSDESSDASLDETRAALGSLDPGVIPGGHGIDLNEIFPTNKATMGSQVANYSQAARSVCKSTLDGRPINFGAVLPGAVYRSSFPMPENLPFLGTLGLKTILSLVNHDFPPELKEFLTSNGIRHCIVEMQGTKRVEIPDIVMNSIMEIALNKDNHPLLIHCNHGRHRTGCAIAVFRHVSGWHVDQIVQEYQGFAEPKARECDVKYITEYKITKLAGFFRERGSLGRGSSILTTSRMQNLLLVSAAAIAVWITTGVLWGEGYL